MTFPFRIGIGFDAHSFAPPGERPLIIGGTEIPHPRGLAGHTDADVLFHSLGDAILGALGNGDMGQHFPDTDQRWKGIASSRILADIAAMMREDGYAVVNVDTVVIAQEPKLAPYAQEIRENIGRILGVPVASVGVKAKTTEHLGFIGRREGIAATAVVLLSRER